MKASFGALAWEDMAIWGSVLILTAPSGRDCARKSPTLVDEYVMVYKPSGSPYSYFSGEETRTQELEFARLSPCYVPLLLDISSFKRSGLVTVWERHAEHGSGLKVGTLGCSSPSGDLYTVQEDASIYVP